jgi:hypothetical protein
MCVQAGSINDGLRWDSVAYQKHIRRVSKRKWDRSIAKAETAVPSSSSQYNPHLSEQQIECLEMRCARGEIGFRVSQSERTETFFARVDIGTHVGVSGGEHTDYLFVVKQGSMVHGYPIHRGDLISRKRAKVSDVNASPSQPC